MYYLVIIQVRHSGLVTQTETSNFTGKKASVTAG